MSWTPSDSRGRHNYGMWNEIASPTIQNNMTGAGNGTNDIIHNTVTSPAYLVKTNNSHNPGNTRTIYQDSHYTTHVGAPQLTGGGAFVAAYLCVASYNGNYTAFDSTCYQVQP